MPYCKVSCLNKKDPFYKSFPYKWILVKIKAEFNRYFQQFSAVLQKHFEKEFEIQIRCRRITDDGEELLRDMDFEFKLLQFEENVVRIVDKFKSDSKVRNKTYIQDLLNIVSEDMIQEVSQYVSRKHNEVLKDHRKSNNELCRKKCENGPSLLNFTSIKLHKKLENFLSFYYEENLKLKPSKMNISEQVNFGRK